MGNSYIEYLIHINSTLQQQKWTTNQTEGNYRCLVMNATKVIAFSVGLKFKPDLKPVAKVFYI